MRTDLPHGDIDAPTADDLFGDPDDPRPWEAVAQLANAGLLTERQAEIYVRRAIGNEPRDAVADDLGISISAVDNHYGRAKELLEAAHRTLATLDAYRGARRPDECSECGGSLSHRWAEDDDGNAFCRECAGLGIQS